jgi:[acyl-carrier-protein] S-malonyltransferase
MSRVAITAWMFPGQVSQSVGMGRDLLASYAPARELVSAVSDLGGVDYARIIARGPEALLARTDILQPALTAINLGCCLLLRESGLPVHAVAGHSLGEFSALYAAGVLELHDVLRLVVARGRLMHDVSSRLDGGMLAVSGLDLAIVDSIVADVARSHVLGIANHNTPAQTVISGERAGLARAARLLALLGGRCVPLEAGGPWHSPLLRPAAERFVEVLRAVKFHDARVPVVLNVSGSALTGAAEIHAQLEQQMCSPVLWVQVQRTLRALGVRRLIEVGPGKVLRGLARATPELAACEIAKFDGPKALVAPALAAAAA